MGPDFSKTYSYADYLQWPEGERVELIDGIPFFMKLSLMKSFLKN